MIGINSYVAGPFKNLETVTNFTDVHKEKKKRSRALLVSSHYAKGDEVYKLQKVIDCCNLPFSVRGHQVSFYNPFEDTVDTVFVESVGSVHWRNYFKGLECVEAIATQEAISYIKNKQRGEEDLVNFDNIAHRYRKETKDTCFLSILLGTDYFKARYKTRNLSVTDSFFFPMSMFRVEMVQHFNNPWDPTPEEFLFAVVMEGINAKTPEENLAIEKAKILVQGKGRPG